MICVRCNKFEANPKNTRHHCSFCKSDLLREVRRLGGEIAYNKGAKRVWVGKGECPVDLSLPN